MAISGKLSWPMRVRTTGPCFFFFLSVSMGAKNKSELFFRRQTEKKNHFAHNLSSNYPEKTPWFIKMNEGGISRKKKKRETDVFHYVIFNYGLCGLSLSHAEESCSRHLVMIPL